MPSEYIQAPVWFPPLKLGGLKLISDQENVNEVMLHDFQG